MHSPQSSLVNRLTVTGLVAVLASAGVLGTVATLLARQSLATQAQEKLTVVGDAASLRIGEWVAGNLRTSASVTAAAALELERTLGDVVDDAVARHVRQRLGLRHAPCPGADDDAQFHLPVRLLRALRHHHRVVRAGQGAAGLQEDDGLGGQRHLRFGRVILVVQADADELGHAMPRHRQPRARRDDRQGVDLHRAQAVEAGGREIGGADVADLRAQVAQDALGVDEAGPFMAARAVAEQFHADPFELRTMMPPARGRADFEVNEPWRRRCRAPPRPRVPAVSSAARSACRGAGAAPSTPPRP